MPAPRHKKRSASSEPTGFHVYASNRIEVLVEKLAATMQEDPLGPLEREVIVVQSRGMYRWLTLELARRLGIAATIATPFPGTFCRALAERVEGKLAAAPGERYEPAERSPFELDILSWRLFRLLRNWPSDARGPAAAYIKDDPDQRKRFQLAVRLAERFDEYQLYRPELLHAWERDEQPITTPAHGDTAAWQAALWRMLVAESGSVHLGRRFDDLIRGLREATTSPRGISRRVSVFGAGSLPPIFLDLLLALARFSSVSIYLVSPTKEYWSDIRSPREAAKQRDHVREKGLAEEYAHFEIGHPMLASLGRQGRDLAALLHERDTDGSAWVDLAYCTPERRNVLGTLQADVVELVERGTGDSRTPPLVMPAGDLSLEVHVCHSPLREMQVIRDVILDAFANDRGLRPHDVFVLAPDITAYAPYIEAVFGVSHADEPALPFTIADRGARSEQPIVDAAFRMLDMVNGRVAASDVLGLLDAASVRRAAALDESNLPEIRDWVRKANIRWGMDGTHRREGLDLPCDDFDTWRAGLDRLLMGYAIGELDAQVAGVVPRGTAASEPAVLGRFTAFADRLFSHLRALAAPRGLSQWASDVRTALDALLVAEGEVEESALDQVHRAVGALAEAENLAAVGEDVDLAVIRTRLRADVESASGGAGFMSGAITFCSLRPMRAIPARLLCIAGLGNEAFPRRDRAPSFDLVAAAPRPGDPSPRDDDRYAFLEAVLSARDRLVLSYVGRSQTDNRELAPSSVLSELLDVVDRSYGVADGEAPPRAALTRVHALQPFDPRYFDEHDGADSRMFSYSRENCRAAAGLFAEPTQQPFIRAVARGTDEPVRPDDPAAEGVVGVSLADLVAFWVSPSQYFCRQVLRLRLPEDDGNPEDSEPFAADTLADYAILDRLIARRLDGLSPDEDELAAIRAGFGFPHAALGRARHQRLGDSARVFTDRLIAVSHGKTRWLEPLLVDLPADGWRLVGRIDRLTEGGLLHYRPADIKPKDYIRAWIPHLALCALASRNGDRTAIPPVCTTIVGKREVLTFGHVTDAETLLAQLVAGYLEGRSVPPPVFERASFAYAKQARELARPGTRASKPAIETAHAAFHGSSWGEGSSDADDPYVRIVFRDRAPLDDDTERFERLARGLWDPILEAATEVEIPEDGR